MKMTMPAALLLMAFAATASAKAPEAVKLDPREAKDLAAALDGKVPGKPVNCVPADRGSAHLQAIGAHTLLYKVSKKLVYRNDVEGSCSGLGMGDALVSQIWNEEYCRGDIARAVDLTTGTTHGSCVLGQFVPYTPADAG